MRQSLDAITRAKIYKKCNQRCYNCNRDLVTLRCKECEQVLPETNWHIHHLIPVFMGGSDHIDNLITVCYFCHKKLHRSGWYSLPQIKDSMVTEKYYELQEKAHKEGCKPECPCRTLTKEG